MYDKIMIATDGSENARLAVRHAAELARLTGSSEALIVHVCTSCSVDLDPDESNLEAAKEIVREAADVMKEAGLSTTGHVETAYPPESVGNAIIDIAGSEKADLVVLGSRGLSEFKGMLLGSVSSKVVQKTDCPVLVIKGEGQG
ncbi:MAG: universal stress protein [Gaiellales bacterium]|nr:MAG: universal stress protein [Gaiellales bacterium]